MFFSWFSHNLLFHMMKQQIIFILTYICALHISTVTHESTQFCAHVHVHVHVQNHKAIMLRTCYHVLTRIKHKLYVYIVTITPFMILLTKKYSKKLQIYFQPRSQRFVTSWNSVVATLKQKKLFFEPNEKNVAIFVAVCVASQYVAFSIEHVVKSFGISFRAWIPKLLGISQYPGLTAVYEQCTLFQTC